MFVGTSEQGLYRFFINMLTPYTTVISVWFKVTERNMLILPSLIRNVVLIEWSFTPDKYDLSYLKDESHFIWFNFYQFKLFLINIKKLRV